jgi:hypothetical protein
MDRSLRYTMRTPIAIGVVGFQRMMRSTHHAIHFWNWTNLFAPQ